MDMISKYVREDDTLADADDEVLQLLEDRDAFLYQDS